MQARRFPNADTARIGSLDGLRAIAILLVLLQHFTPGHDSNNGWRSVLFKLADIGWVGVDLFFVLSGFLITGILLRARELNRPLKQFVMRRLLRIAPAYYLALATVFWILPAAGVLPFQPAQVQLPFFAYISNFFWSSYDRWSQIGLSHFWSLALEMQFYLLWPVLVYRLSVTTLVRFAILALVFSVWARACGAAAGIDATMTFGWTPFRLDGLILGSLVAAAVHRGVRYESVRGAVRAAMVAGGAFAFLVAWFDHGGGMWMQNQSLENVFFTAAFPFVFSAFFAALLMAALQAGRLRTVLSAEVFKPIARYSYGIYIIHFICAPAFARLFGPPVMAQWFDGPTLPIYAFFCAASAVSFLMAALSFHLFEIYFLRLKGHFA